MTCERRDAKPAWWLLNAIELLLLGLLALVEMFVQAGGLRGVLEIAVVIAMFRLMATWVRHNRVAIELEELECVSPASATPGGSTGRGDSRGAPIRALEDTERPLMMLAYVTLVLPYLPAIGWGALSARPWARGV